MTLDEYLATVRERAESARNIPAFVDTSYSREEAAIEATYALPHDVRRLLAIIEAQRAEMNRLFDALQGSGLLMGLAGNALVGARFEKGEL